VEIKCVTNELMLLQIEFNATQFMFGAWLKAGNFPAPIRLGENRVVWAEDEVYASLYSKRRERDEGGIAGFFLGATNGREAAETTLGTEFSDHEWSEFGQNCNDGWDRMLL
jgi:hypothetical protein